MCTVAFSEVIMVSITNKTKDILMYFKQTQKWPHITIFHVYEFASRRVRNVVSDIDGLDGSAENWSKFWLYMSAEIKQNKTKQKRFPHPQSCTRRSTLQHKLTKDMQERISGNLNFRVKFCVSGASRFGKCRLQPLISYETYGAI